MADRQHVVRFEPVGIEIEVDEDQTILRAAFERGVLLPHGCKEGQCASCKSFVLEGEDIELDKYSTRAAGLRKGRRLHAAVPGPCLRGSDDRAAALRRGADPIRAADPEAVTEVVSNERVTHDMRHLVIRLIEPKEIKFFPGQYLDFAIPDTDESRSFSMANTSSRDGRLEFVIKIYPDGLFSHFLDTQVNEGDAWGQRPYGVFTLREGRHDLMFIGGGAGMAPILSLLRSMAERGITRRATYYYGARRRRDLCFEEELRALEGSLSNFRYIPALSEPEDDDDWDGEVGLITDVVARHESDLSRADGYVGPPPMVDAAIAALTRLGVPEQRIYYDKFTTTGEAGTLPRQRPNPKATEGATLNV